MTTIQPAAAASGRASSNSQCGARNAKSNESGRPLRAPRSALRARTSRRSWFQHWLADKLTQPVSLDQRLLDLCG